MNFLICNIYIYIYQGFKYNNDAKRCQYFSPINDFYFLCNKEFRMD
jgi:hypothetical protein